MIAVILTGSKQYLVREGDEIQIEKVKTPIGDNHIFDRVLMIGKDEQLIDIGTPFLKTTVSGKILNHGKNEKVRVYKMKAKKNYRRVYGHRQPYTTIKITKIS